MKSVCTVIIGWVLAILSGSALAAPTTEPATPADARSADYSGLECMARALRQVGRPVDPVQLVAADQLDLSGRSSLDSLERIAGEQGAHATILRDMSVQQLTEAADPVILHVKGNQFAPHADHFVVHLGRKDHQARILNPPDPEMLIPYSLLATRWQGDAVIVSPPEPASGSTASYRRSLAIPYGVVGLLALAGAAGAYTWHKARPSASPQGLLRSACHGFGLLAAGGALGIAWHAVGQAPFLDRAMVPPPQNPAALMDFVGKVDTAAEAPIPKIDHDTSVRLLTEGALFVDARGFGEFTAGHVKGAISGPADRGSRIKLDLAGIPHDRQIVVYCASAECGKANYVAALLRQEGYMQVSVFPGGWAEWKGPKSR